jgi:O-antigen/teichoic acid export membrane protein
MARITTISKNIVFQIAITILSLLQVIMITRCFGIAARGHHAVYNNAIALLSLIGSLGLGSAIVYMMGLDKKNTNVLFTTLAKTSFIVLIGMIILFPAIHILHLTKYAISYSTEVKYLVFFGLHLFCLILQNWCSSLLQAKQYYTPTLLFQVAFLSIQIGIIAILFFQQSSSAFVDFIMASAVIYALLTSYFVFYTIQKCKLKFDFSNSTTISSLFTYASIAFLCNVFQMLSYRMDIWFLKNNETIETVGIYSIAVLVIQTLWVLGSQIANVLFTFFCDSTIQIEHKIKTVIAYTSALWWWSILVFAAAWLSSYFYLPIIFGESVSEAFYFIGILSIGAIPISSAIVISTFFASQHMLRINLIGSAIGLVFGLLFYSILIPSYKAYGASWASVIAYTTNCVYLYFCFCKQYKISILQLFSFQNIRGKGLQLQHGIS